MVQHDNELVGRRKTIIEIKDGEDSLKQKQTKTFELKKNGKKLILLIVFFHVLTKQKRSYEKGI
jgi:hypothetical protein